MMASLQHLSEARHDILRSFSLYSDLKSPYLKHRTLRDVYLPTKKSVLRHLGDKEVRAYTSIDCLRYLQALISNQKPNGINIRIRTLRTFGFWAAKHNILPRDNAFQSMATLKVPDMPIRFLTQEEFTRIYEAEPSLLFRDIFLAGLLTGLRVGDVVSLTRKQIDLDRRVIRIATTKSGRMLAIPIHPTLHLIFQRRWESEPTIWGRAPHRTTVTHKFKCAATKAGIPDVHLHLLRKTFASWLALNGADIFRMQQLLGHSTPTLTAKLYSSLTADSLRSEIERLPSLPTIGGRSEMGQRDTEVTGVTP